MSSLLWKLLAKLVSIPAVADYLIAKAKKTPYFHLPDYMDRYWLFNRYSEIGSMNVIKKKYSWLPSIRIHHILREDVAPDLHDHPWNARTIILKGDYVERRRVPGRGSYTLLDGIEYPVTIELLRSTGDTATINFGEYHAIDEVSKGGVWTLFFTWEYMGTWGFLVNGKKVPWREYEGRTE